ncbi:MAG: hypothetical protein JNK74_01445 [Candidatus Hydrogenedentes bacterium]|nr:hypothetical protein [Candidatus Hydrogenedentota bacterium]
MNVSSASGYSNVAFSRPERPQGPPPSPEDFAAKLLEDLDTNTDGALSAEEIGAAGDSRLQELFEAADADGDGLLTESEIIADGEKRAQEFGDRSMYPPPGLVGETDIDLASLLESSSRGISAYQSNSLWSSLFERSGSLNLAG